MWRQDFRLNAPGGNLCHASVRDHVHGRLELAFEEIGALNLKNIARPVEAFVLRLETAATGSVERPLVHGHGKLCRCRANPQSPCWRSPI